MPIEIFTNTLFLLTTIFLVISLFFRSGEYRAPIAYISFWFMWALISTYANDFGGYNFELRMNTYPSFATTLLSIFYFVFFLGIYFFLRVESNFNRYTNNFRPYKLNLSKGFTFILIMIFAVVIFYETISAIASFEIGISRAEAFKKATFFGIFFAEYPFIAPILIASSRFVHNGYFKSFSSLLALAYIVMLIGLGNKFTSILEFFFYYLVPIYWLSGTFPIKLKLGETLMSVFTFKYFSLITLFTILVFSSYSQISTNDNQLIFELLYDRVFLFQGQLFWISFQDYSSMNFIPGEQLYNEISKIISPGSIPNHKSGLQFVMVQALGDNAYPIIQKGYLYTQAFPGILLYMFDMKIIFIIMMLFGFFTCFIFYVWKLSVKKDALLLQLVTLSILSPFITMLSTGNFYVFFTLLSIIKFFIMMGLLIIGNKK